MSKAVLTDKKGRALCLAYRDGKRCRRLAKVVGICTDDHGGHRMALCAECAKRLGAAIEDAGRKGFTVHTRTLSGWTERTYTAIK